MGGIAAGTPDSDQPLAAEGVQRRIEARSAAKSERRRGAAHAADGLRAADPAHLV